MSTSFLSATVAAFLALLPAAGRAADSSPTYAMTIRGEEEIGKVVKEGMKSVFLTCPGGKTYDIDTASLKPSPRPCPETIGNYGNFAATLLDFDANKGSYMVMTKDGETKSLSAAPFLLKDFAKGQQLWVAIDKSPLSTPYALERVQ